MPWSAWTTRSPGVSVASSERKASVDFLRRRRRTGGEVDDAGAFRLVELGGEMERPRLDQGAPLFAGEIERFRLERPVAARLASLGAPAVVVIIGDRLEAGVGGPGVVRIAHDD